MFLYLLWKADIYSETDEEIQNEIWAYLRTIYLQNPRKYVGLFSVKDILDLIVISEKKEMSFVNLYFLG
jgi:Rad3-related DNA helicase